MMRMISGPLEEKLLSVQDGFLEEPCHSMLQSCRGATIGRCHAPAPAGTGQGVLLGGEQPPGLLRALIDRCPGSRYCAILETQRGDGRFMMPDFPTIFFY